MPPHISEERGRIWNGRVEEGRERGVLLLPSARPKERGEREREKRVHRLRYWKGGGSVHVCRKKKKQGRVVDSQKREKRARVDSITVLGKKQRGGGKKGKKKEELASLLSIPARKKEEKKRERKSPLLLTFFLGERTNDSRQKGERQGIVSPLPERKGREGLYPTEEKVDARHGTRKGKKTT